MSETMYYNIIFTKIIILHTKVFKGKQDDLNELKLKSLRSK